MTITPGLQRLTAALSRSYRIERELGAGGMATVYLAHDLKHDRDVAIKVLHPDLGAALGGERFLSEIKTTAKLQHPHILPLLDSGETDGLLYYVMPYLTGETLRARLERERQLPIEEAVRIAREVADALGSAHALGIIHRDIKPENILLQGGHALVADFGIALAVQQAAGHRMTQTGLSLGTPQYMSPEQAMGEKTIDLRSDVYALGAVTYEMLAGDPPFTGSSVQAIIAKALNERPTPLTTLRDTVPPGVDRAVMKALARLPADRFASAAAFAEALSGPSIDGTVTVAGAVPAPTRSRGSRVAAAAVWIVVGAVGAGLGLRQFGRTATAGSDQREQVTYSGRATAPAISADGRFVAYLDTRCPEPPATGGCVNLHVLEIGGTSPVEVIAGAARLGTPRWTHDGLAIVVGGVLADGRSGLFTVPRLGGIPKRIADEPVAYDTHPSADSVALVIGRDSTTMLQVISGTSGLPVGAAVPFQAESRDLAWSPDGRRFAVTGRGNVTVVGRDGSRLSSANGIRTRASVRWSADGRRILNFRWSAGQYDDLLAFPVDGSGMLGAPSLVASQLQTLVDGKFDLARGTGRVIVGGGAAFSDIWSFDQSDANLRARRLTQGTNWHSGPVLTADGRTLYYLRADPLGNSLYRIVDRQEAALTADRQIVNSTLRLSSDERAVVFESLVDSGPVLMIYDRETGSVRQVPRGATDIGWLLGGGREVLWGSQSIKSIWITDAQGTNRRVVTSALDGPLNDINGGGGDWFLAPDGRSVAVLDRTRDAAVLKRIALKDGSIAMLGRFPSNAVSVGLAGWSGDGMIYLARRRPGLSGTTIDGVDATTGATRPVLTLPATCDLMGVSYAPAGRRAACVVRETRSDLMMIDGLRP